jgi:hypothetical protein
VSNSARSAIRTRVRRLLNEQTATDSFWTDADLNDFIDTAHQNYYRRVTDQSGRHGRQYCEFINYGNYRDRLDFTGDTSGNMIGGTVIAGHTSAATAVVVCVVNDTTSSGTAVLSQVVGTFGAAEQIDVVGGTNTAGTTAGANYLADYFDFDSGLEIEQIIACEDYTSESPGVELTPCTTYREVMVLQEQLVGVDPNYTNGEAFRFFFEKAEKNISGSIFIRERMYLAPVAKSERKIRLHVLTGPAAMSSDTLTTGLPDYAEACMVLDAAIQARMMEESPAGASLGVLTARLEKAEMELLRHVKNYTRGPSQVQFFDVID